MTNSTVGNLVVSQGRRMTVKYGDGEKTCVVVPDDVPIVGAGPGRAQPAQAWRQGRAVPAEGRRRQYLTALAISVGKDGVTPPM